MRSYRKNAAEIKWRDYFVQLPKGDEISEVGALKKTKGGKAACMEAIVVEMMENGGINIMTGC